MINRDNKVDYAGRTVDLLLLKTVEAVPVVNKRVGIDVSDDPMVVTGVEKMVQRYAVLFVNAAGTTMFRSLHGTDLVPRVSSGKVYNLATLETAAALANMDASRNMAIADASEDTPDDERLVDSEVVKVEFSRAKASVMVSVRLTTAAGKSYVYIIPVGVGVR